YADYLAGERGLVTTSMRGYTDLAQRFIDAKFGAKSPDWRALVPADVFRFITREFRRLSLGGCKLTVTQLRSLLRYLPVQGHLTHDLAACVPVVAGWRLASLPKGLEPEQVERMLASCDPCTLVGSRDRAVLCLLVRLGLRASEVAALRLDGGVWRGGEIVVRGK